ncbi:MAG: pseudouridine synthase [Gammaproteobacteria bacterium]
MLELIWRDPHYVAVYKPAGLLVHRSPIDSRETRFLVQELRDQLGTRVYPVHRLDKPTAGIMIFALDPAAASALAPAFSGALGGVRKTYQAVVRGWFEGEGVIDHPIAPKADERALSGRDAPQARDARTHHQMLDRVEIHEPVGRYDSVRYSRLSLSPLSGRKHQLRRHMKHVFHPILGDTTYGHGVHNRFLREYTGVSRLMLVATGLSFVHPFSGEHLALRARVDDEWASVCAALGFSAAVDDARHGGRV